MKTVQEEIRLVEGRGLPLPGDDIDTDRIIPARYLKCVTFDELGEYAFYDERFDSSGERKEHPFNDSRFEGAKILLVGRNFGCGSSREHAPQSLMRSGIRAIVGESFAEIFSGNCITLGIPVITAGHEELVKISEIVQNDPSITLSIDLVDKGLTVGVQKFVIAMPATYRKSLVEGSWDSTAALIENIDDIRKTAGNLYYMRSS